ncbi:MAG: septal ring lytic transglycosylase RlpA family protein [Pseudorhodoplanes sp.]|nr:hypothetical protein [Pseudorhodoplanes sp.]MBW7949475.1 septal ring lytic transglycosylase RlpA family protein [Pseudorhodoplanes sp.]MCL4710775.1 septal ring lytic transglycosylase RlpA family protein [Pseudorhodoplanes sp.]
MLLSGKRGAAPFGWRDDAVCVGTRRVLAVVALGLLTANCASSDKFVRNVDPKYGVTSSPRVVDAGQPVPKGGGTYRVGKPYTIAGRSYTPEENRDYRAEGLASWYGDDFHGRLTANGEVFDMHAISAAHPTLPMPSYVRVTNLANRRSIIVRVNDRGPYHGNRIIDLSHKTADLLGFKGNGIARVRVEYVGRAALDGSDDRKLLATLRHGDPAPAPATVRLASAQPMLGRTNDSRRLPATAPVPAGRPYTLGQDRSDDDGPAAPPAGVTATDLTASRTARPTSALPSPVSAFAGSRDAMPAAFMSGRGLY